MSENISNQSLFATVFTTGAAVLIIEVTAVRILSPFYGSSLYVLSSVLTVILAALSVGYWYGGKRADKEQSIDFLYFIIATSGLFILGLLLLSKFLLPMVGILLPPTIGPLLFSLGLFFIPAFLLGIVSPYVIKIQSLTNSMENIGSVVGATFFWGTVGSIFGSLMTGFVFIPLLGVSKTILLVSVVLIALGLLVPISKGGSVLKARSLVIVALSLVLGISILVFDKKIDSFYVYNSEGVYSSIRITDTLLNGQPIRLLLRDTNNSSAIFLNSKKFVFPYAKFSLLYKDLLDDPKEALVLGGGAYTIPRSLVFNDPEIHVDVVEIEPILFDLSQKFFDLSDVSRITNHVVDARVFLQQPSDKKYDLIFSDLFSTDYAAPFHLASTEFYELITNKLTPDGVFILNIVGKLDSPQPSLAGSVAKTLNANFKNLKAYTLEEDATSLQNIIFIATKNSKPIELSAWDLQKIENGIIEVAFSEEKLANEIFLTDDHAPIEYLATRQTNQKLQIRVK